MKVHHLGNVNMVLSTLREYKVCFIDRFKFRIKVFKHEYLSRIICNVKSYEKMFK